MDDWCIRKPRELLDEKRKVVRCADCGQRLRGLDRPADAGDGSDGKVRGEIELFTDGVIDDALELYLIGGLGLPRRGGLCD